MYRMCNRRGMEAFLLGVFDDFASRFIYSIIFFQVRTRGSIKRRPPSRRFRKSQSEYGDDLDLGMALSHQENGAKENEEEENVFADKSKTTKPLSPTADGIDNHEKQNQVVSDQTSHPDLVPNRTEHGEKEGGTEVVTLCKDTKKDKPHQTFSEKKQLEEIKVDKEKNPTFDTADNTKRKSWQNILWDREDGNTSDQENKGEKEGKLCENEDAQHVSDTQETGLSLPEENTETASSTRV
ncbi:hypothetical protein JD844_032874 [Phrynosoma platyrhinos]|uniref:Uncharacterized protein n=1 Tax=Phrynosoma platyrhinos TaxID=52577 RepID=A0ABQ7T643_PHRPL|nr:hypothetical protein JD844_032874 [Phrynosoma platyrhinos]